MSTAARSDEERAAYRTLDEVANELLRPAYITTGLVTSAQWSLNRESCGDEDD